MMYSALSPLGRPAMTVTRTEGSAGQGRVSSTSASTMSGEILVTEQW